MVELKLNKMISIIYAILESIREYYHMAYSEGRDGKVKILNATLFLIVMTFEAVITAFVYTDPFQSIALAFTALSVRWFMIDGMAGMGLGKGWLYTGNTAKIDKALKSIHPNLHIGGKLLSLTISLILLALAFSKY